MSRQTKKLDAYIITLINDARSMTLARTCVQSIMQTQSKINPHILPATTPREIEYHLTQMQESDIDMKPSTFRDALLVESKHYDAGPTLANYTWPITDADNRLDLATGLQLNAYRAKDYRKIVACTVSHMRAWIQCIRTNRPIIVLEQDAYFAKQFMYDRISSSKDDEETWGIIGLNYPQAGQTRRASTYIAEMEKHATSRNLKPLMEVPTVNKIGEPPVPQGLAGNSAYMIKPWAARALLNKTVEIGIWPNDALICKELFPWIRQIGFAVTAIQEGSPSTTTG